jgi:hypothetical protein
MIGDRGVAQVIGGGKKAPDGTGVTRAGIGKSIAPSIASR